ncbi:MULTISPECIES: LysR family transcriptional regulator [Rhodopseudomonas]|uniref:LysR family transcriptional regulator n=1 Tax=Rhodopseudomonas palustris TaxID=1076 RepID=A0A0D7E9W3_RHOPL|nr:MULTISPECIES: LysR family transcriptional regulator [Rhodopseudomonas]KIZ37421.1 LysR family transcriptional regulator [Rhodopseudomonas palustris]MDF3814015.1 LysR substrate-binding domain-containing protein [Rhodopseudomonas sp. BAL398]WOK16834.1 LysR substrate-binding domain-containing protein [Rhodopseudomonas sp. BAL398]
MDLAELRIFCAVVRAGGVTRAAERLHRVQSNVTTRLRQLEDDLGQPLFVREGKRLHLTPAGRVLLGYADRILALADEARAALQDSQPRGVLRIGAMESTAAVRLPAPLNEFHRRYPQVTLELRIGTPDALAKAILAGELDAAFVAEPIADAPFDKMHAFDEVPVIVSAADHPEISAQGAAPRAVLVFENGCPHRKRLEDWYRKRGAMPERTTELGSYHAMLGCVVAGMGIALLPESVLTTFPESKRLTVHRLPEGENRAETVLIWRKGTSSPNIGALQQALRDAAALRPSLAS